MRATLYEWKEFVRSNIYLDLVDEIEARRCVIKPLLIAGKDPVWSDDNMRGRLDELDFVDSIPEDVIACIELEEQPENEERKGPLSVMGSFFKSLNKGEA